MKSLWLPALLAAVALLGCGKKDQAKKSPDEPSGAGNPATAPLDYLAAQGRAKKFAEKTITAAELTSAIQKFNAMEDRFPRDLNELVQQHYLQAPPAAPKGMRWHYDAQTGAVRLVADTAPAAAAGARLPAGLPGVKNLPVRPAGGGE
jgi:hypothetical protein